MITHLKKNLLLLGLLVMVVVVFAVAFAPSSVFAGIGSDFICCVNLDGGGGGWGGGGWGGGGGGGGGGCVGAHCNPDPFCTLTASPSGPVAPGSPVTLTWSTFLAQSASISPGVGPISPVSGGSVVVNPTVNTTYTMTTQHATYGSVTCQVTVQVTPPNGCIYVLKETFNTEGERIFPVAQFTFKLDGNAQTAFNDATGLAFFGNVTPGTHTVTELVPPTWTQLSVTPVNGVVVVPPGPDCVTVVFKNKQVINEPPPACTLDIDLEVIEDGDSATLTWTATNAVQVSTDNDDLPITSLTGGSVSISPTTTTTYKITVLGENGDTVTCQDQVTVTPPVKPVVKATKIVCEDESDLPNWGNGGPNITATTATDWVANHPDCHLASDWEFEWANGGVSNPGDNVSSGGANWNTFGPTNGQGIATAVINSFTGGKIWVREKPSSSYIPFTGLLGSNVSAEMYCHTDVLNYDNYDKIDSPQNGQTYHCVAFNVPKPPPGTGCIEILKETYDPNGNPVTPVAQFTFKLDGNAATAHNNSDGYARFDGVSVGLHTVTEILPPTWTQLSVTPVNGTVHVTAGPDCVGVVFKNKQVITSAPYCTLTGNPTSFGPGGGVTQLTWTTQNATSFTINNGIGSVTPVSGGNVNANVTQNTTFVGTATGPGGTFTCEVPVTITSPNPACTLTISKNEINTGESVVVSWTSSNVTEGYISPLVGTTTPVSSGSATVFPPSDTTFTGTFSGPHGSVQCQVFVKVKTTGCVSNCGGGFNPPNVVLFQKPGDQPLAAVFLSQIPYTGFEAGPILSTIFWLAVAIFSALIAYYIVGRGSMTYVFGQLAEAAGIPTEREIRDSLRDREAEMPREESREEFDVQTKPYAMSAPAAPAPVAYAPTYTPAPSAPLNQSGIPAITDVIESRAHAAGVLMSPEAVELAANLAPDRAEALRMFGDILNEAVKSIPREDGWIMLTSDRFAALRDAKAQTVPAPAPIPVTAFKPAPAVSAPAVQTAKPQATKAAVLSKLDEASASEFVGAVLSGNRTSAFNILRSMEHDAVSPTALITSAATVLDRLYRIRHGGQNGIATDLMAKSAQVSDEKLQKLVEVFTHALDTVYANPFTGIKLALAQAFEIVG